MNRLRSLDVVLLIIFVPLWMLCCVLYVYATAHGKLAWAPFSVRAPESADGYPTVREFLPSASAAPSAFVVGDQLISLGKTDLRGVGPFGFVARVYEEIGSDLRIPVTFIRAGQQAEAPLILSPIASPWVFLPFTLSFMAAGVFVLLHERGSRQARAFFFASLALSFHWTFFFGEQRWQTYAWAIVHFLSAVVLLPLLLRFALVFPEKLTLTGFRTPTWVWLFAVLGPMPLSMVFGVPLSPSVGFRANFVVNSAFLITLLVVMTRNFRRANPVGRRQIKWVIYGLYIGLAPVLAVEVFVAVNPSFRWLHEMSMAAPILIPFCICLALLRENFFDIDRLMSSTASYSLLLVFLTGAMVLMVPPLAQVAHAAVGVDPVSWQTAFSVVFALLLMPGERRLRPQIERVFFPTRYAIEQGAEQLLRDIPTCMDPQALLLLITERLDELLQPESFVLYANASTSSVPLIVRGGAVPPILEAGRPLLSALRARRTPLEVDRWRSAAKAYLDSEDLEALDRIRATIVIPFTRGERLVAFLCLGQKRSGDVYVSTDLALLAVVVDKTATEFMRFTEPEVEKRIAALMAP